MTGAAYGASPSRAVVLHARAAGEGQPGLVCLHGLVDTLAVWDRIRDPLARRGALVLVDQRAHGASPAPPGPYTREDLAADVVLALDRHGIESALLVGHSMGGIVAMATALGHPQRVKGLVLIGTASQVSEKAAGWYARIADAGERDGTRGLARAIYGAKTRKRVVGDARGIASVTRVLASLHGDPLTPRLRELACPVLLIVGENDPMGPRASRIIAENVVDATLEVVPNCGHWVHVEAPEAVLAAIDRWRGEGS